MKISAGNVGVVVSLFVLAFASGCATAKTAQSPSEVITATHAELAHTVDAHTVDPAAVEEWRSVSALLEPGLDAKLMDSENPYESKADLGVGDKDGLTVRSTWGTGIPAKTMQPALPEMLDGRE